MKIMVIDSGGRGDTLAWAVRQDLRVREVFCVPGNAGMEKNAIKINPGARTPEEIVKFALEKKVDLAIGGAESFLSAGIADVFQKHGIAFMGPKKEATILESSKGYTDLLCREIGVPVPEFEIFKDVKKAKKYINSLDYEVVVKCDGLAAGKGAIVCESKDEAYRAVDFIFEKQKSGEWGGKTVVVQKRIFGRELSFFFVSDGHTLKALPVAQDYKRAKDNNEGKNTGGMGAYSPHEWESPNLTEIVTKKIAQPLIDGFRKKREVLYQGFFYCGLIFENDDINKPVLLEINVRLGDPEAEVILPRLKTSLVDICQAVIEQKLSNVEIEWSEEYFCDVVLASGEVKRTGKGKYPGYPGRYKSGLTVSGYEKNDFACLTFSAGLTRNQENEFVTSGGRVIHLVGRGKTIKEARQTVYREIEKIHFDGMYFRKDIGLISR